VVVSAPRPRRRLATGSSAQILQGMTQRVWYAGMVLLYAANELDLQTNGSAGGSGCNGSKGLGIYTVWTFQRIRPTQPIAASGQAPLSLAALPDLLEANRQAHLGPRKNGAQPLDPGRSANAGAEVNARCGGRRRT
jgi:hypothetical protein